MKQTDTGLYARLTGDPALCAIVGTDPGEEDPRIAPGWPDEVLEKPKPEDFPRITFLIPPRTALADGVEDSVVHISMWAWSGDNAAIDAMEERLRAILAGKHWWHDGARLYADVITSTDDPGVGEEPHRRTLTVALLTSAE